MNGVSKLPAWCLGMCLLYSVSSAQNFSSTLSGTPDFDFGISILKLPDSKYALFGSTIRPGSTTTDLFISILDSAGNPVSGKITGSPLTEDPKRMIWLGPSGFISAGQSSGFGQGGGDLIQLRSDLNGNTLWMKAYGGTGSDLCNSIEKTADGGSLLSGSTNSFGTAGAGTSDMYLIKTDSLGTILWTRTFGANGASTNDRGFHARETKDGKILFIGVFNYTFIVGEIYLVKLDSAGNKIWSKMYGGGNREEGRTVYDDGYGNYIVTGLTRSYGAGSEDIFILKTDTAGTVKWFKTFGGAGSDVPSFFTFSADGGYVLTGRTQSFGGGNRDGFLMKTDTAGNLLWFKTYGSATDDEFYYAETAADSGFFLSGSMDNSGFGKSDAWLLKTDKNGASGNCFEKDTSPVQKDTLPEIFASVDSMTSPSTVETNGIVQDTILSMKSGRLCTPPSAMFNVSADSLCAGTCTGYTDLSSNFPTSWKWTFQSARIASDTTRNPASICYDTAGKYKVSLIVSNAYGSDTLAADSFITVLSLPVVDLGKDTCLQYGDTVLLDAGAFTSYLWKDSSTTQTYATDTASLVWVNVTGVNGCKGSDTILVDICTGTDDVEKNLRLILYPNPAQEIITLEWNGEIKEKTEITIFNFLGQAVLKKIMEAGASPKMTMDLKNILPGTYLIQTKTPSGSVNKILIVQ